MNNWTLNIFKPSLLGFFTAEYLARLVLYPSKINFLLDKTNLVDLLGIVPCYLSLILAGLEDMQALVFVTITSKLKYL